MNRIDFEALGNRHKRFESLGTQQRLMPNTPYVVRLDGRAFHTFTKGLQRPFDTDFSSCLIETTEYLVDKTNADVGYCQSDEITLSFVGNKDLPFDGRISKMGSIYAAMASVVFNQLIAECLPHKAKEMPLFDARIWNLPTVDDLTENLVWRQADASRNSLTMAAHHYFDNATLHGAGYTKKHELLHSVGVNWNDYPTHFKRGTFVQKVAVERFLSPEILAKIPEGKRPTGPIFRNEVHIIDVPILTTLEEPTKLLFK